MIVIAFCGLPGTGKSTLAAALAAQLDAPVLDKDRLRQALFGVRRTAYSRPQDDHCMQLIYETAAWFAVQGGVPCVIVDGRTFLGEGQADRLVIFSRERGLDPRFVLCTAPRAEALRRIDRDLESGAHPASNRTRALFEELEHAAGPIPYPHCVVDTHTLTLAEQVRRVRAWIPI